MTTRIPIPEFDGDFIRIYNPGGDVYKGLDTPSFQNGKFYDEWITNDFSVLKDENTWHIVGITHPRPKGFKNEFDYDVKDIHEAEFQLFHCCAEAKSFKDVFAEETFRDCEKILYPQERPGDRPEMWAPHIMKHDGLYQVIYSPQEMRRMVSGDFADWKKASSLFSCTDNEARDPFIFYENDTFYCLYVEEGHLKYRTSQNMEEWTEERLFQKPFFLNCDTESLYGECQIESPFLFKRNGFYYLLWCFFDNRNGCYDNRTMVFAADTIEGLYNTAPITMLRGHAPEIVVDDDGECYFLSVYYPQNGISAVKIKWV